MLFNIAIDASALRLCLCALCVVRVWVDEVVEAVLFFHEFEFKSFVDMKKDKSN